MYCLTDSLTKCMVLLLLVGVVAVTVGLFADDAMDNWAWKWTAKSKALINWGRGKIQFSIVGTTVFIRFKCESRHSIGTGGPDQTDAEGAHQLHHSLDHLTLLVPVTAAIGPQLKGGGREI